MDSRGRLPPLHLRRPIPGPGIVQPEPIGLGMYRPPGPFPPVDMMSPPEVMEQKIAAQHVEMQRLATENQRLASTHGTLRHELASAQHELQILHAQIGVAKSEREQQMRSLVEKIAKMEAELQVAENVKSELKQAREDAQKLLGVRQELIAKVQQLNQDLQRAHTDVQQLPALMSEFDNLRQDYHQCRIMYDGEKKLYDDHLQQLQVMEKNYMAMSKEVEKLRAELSNSSSLDTRAAPLDPHGVGSGNNGGEGFVHTTSAQITFEDNYSVQQGRGPVPPTAAVSGSGAANAAVGPPAYGGPGAQMGPTPPRPGYDTDRLPGYDPYRASQGYHPQAVYGSQRVSGHDMQRGNYNAFQGPSYAAPGIPASAAYDLSRGQMYDMQSRVTPGQQQQIAQNPLASNMGYSNTTPPPRAGAVGGNPGRK